MSDAFFAGIKPESVETTHGSCELPILYRDASLFAAMWLVDAARARERIAPDAFEPWLVFGRALAMLAVFEYRDTSIGPYGELALAILVKRRGTRPSWLSAARDLRREESAGFYVTNLPVTTERARAAGVELWGYPKYVTTMTTAFDARDARVVLESELEITLPLRMGRGVPTPSFPIVTYSVTPTERIVRTVVQGDFRARWGGARGLRARVLGPGPTADNFRALEMDRVQPRFAFRADPMRAILPLGVDQGPLSRPTSDSEANVQAHA